MSKDYGFKISRPGQDVKTASDVNLLMTSKFKNFTVSTFGTGNVSIANGNYHSDTNVAHGLGYTPAFLVYGKDSSESGYKRIAYTPNIFSLSDYQLFCWADGTNLTLYAEYPFGAPANKTYNFKYYIFNNQIA